MRYRDAGVDIDAGDLAKSQIQRLVRQTFNPRVLKDVGAFGGFFSLNGLPRDAVLVASLDGVGTKLKIAAALNRHATVGADLVHHCVNDIAVHGARPLFFLDYFAAGRLRPRIVAEVVRGLSKACRAVGCALIGGETAQMPDLYRADDYDLAGCIIGWVSRREIIDGQRITPGDVILGLPSLGLHTNGYSFARKLLLEREGMKLTAFIPELGRTLGEELLAPHRCYWPVMRPLIEKGWVKGLVHVTGGGITENTPRILPAGSRAEVRLGAWPVLPIFELIAKRGRVPRDEMFRVFNMGLGLLIVVSRQDADRITHELEKKRERFWIVGRIIRGRPSVKYSGV